MLAISFQRVSWAFKRRPDVKVASLCLSLFRGFLLSRLSFPLLSPSLSQFLFLSFSLSVCFPLFSFKDYGLRQQRDKREQDICS